MLRRNVDEAAEVTRPCTTKIRKRCALSSSSASDPLRKLRLKRGVVLLGLRGGGAASPCSSRKMSESSWNRHCHADRLTDGMRSSVSARKLVNALWQPNKGGLLEEGKEEIARDTVARRSLAHRRCASVELSKRSRTKNKVLEADGDGERSWQNNGHGHWFADKMSNGSTTEVHTCAQDLTSTCSGDRMAHLQDMYNRLIASKELAKLLANIWGPGDLNPSTAALLSALRSELDLARAHARQLVKEQRRRGDEIELLKEQLAEEMRAWKSRQREKVAATVQVIVSELDGERRSRRRSERVNAKLGKALAETESSLRAAERELERERRSRERLEKVCDELVRGGAGADRGEVEEMRREAERAQDELEKEREMLHIADELREERVQMKLLEARLQFEEKSAVVDQLRTELEAFLDTKKDRQGSPAADEHHSNDDYHLQLVPHASEGANGIDRAAISKSTGEEDDDEEGGGGGGECGAGDSDGSDMHSIELNMDGNGKDYSWSCTTASKEMTASKNAASRHGSFSVSDRGTDCAADPWAGAAFDRRPLEVGEELDGDQWDDEGCSDRTRDLDEDAERYLAIKNLREQMLAGHGRFIFLSQGGANADREYHHYGLMCQIEEGKL